MPIYEYECDKCGKIDEVVQKISDEPLVKCRFCSGKVHKLISQSTFHLKGSGWYVTDYAGKADKKPSKGAVGSKKTNGSSKVGGTSKVSSSTTVEKKKTTKKQ
ncbi:MAG: FmdB family transcriptional regulator [Desulfobacteraceae bacterium 4572_19]|nr:MAG: FmdB family transcriptional regulator [Desulfobacteraceae bacterium 4572_19]